jgi:hypothetical protein
MSIDQIANPKLRTGGYLTRWRELKRAADLKRGLT